jgi:flagellar biosynthetic protein FliR
MSQPLDPQNPFLLLLVLARVGSLMLTAPILGSRHVPFKIRILLSGFLAIAVCPLIPNDLSWPFSGAVTCSADADTVAAVDTKLNAAIDSAHWPVNGRVPDFDSVDQSKISNCGDWAFLLLSEISIGIMLGLGVTIIISAARMAGSVIGNLAAMQWTTELDPETHEPITAISQLFGLVSIAVFVAIGGLEMVTEALIQSYRNVPQGIAIAPTSALALLGDLLQQSFLLTLRGVAPAVASLLVGSITIGMLGRAFPYLNTLGLGFNSNQFMFFMATLLTMGGCLWLFLDDVGGVLETVQTNISAQR